MFSCEICKISKERLFYRTPLVAASDELLYGQINFSNFTISAFLQRQLYEKLTEIVHSKSWSFCKFQSFFHSFLVFIEIRWKIWLYLSRYIYLSAGSFPIVNDRRCCTVGDCFVPQHFVSLHRKRCSFCHDNYLHNSMWVHLHLNSVAYSERTLSKIKRFVKIVNGF